MATTEGLTRRWGVRRIVALVFALALVWWAVDSIYAMRLWDRVGAVRTSICRSMTGLRGAEDAVVARNGQVLASLDDRQQNAANGRLVLLDSAESGALLLWDGDGRPFHPHGIDYRIEGDKEIVYVVNHLPTHDAVMVFQLKNRRVELLRQIDYPGRGLNDLAAVGDGRFYATVDHVPSNRLINRLGDYLRLPLGAVEYFDGRQFQRVATGISFANGVAASADGQRLYVASMLAGKVLVFDRDASGGLSRRTAIAVPGSPDNLNWMSPGALLVAAHPRILDLAKQEKQRGDKAPSRVLLLRLAEGRDSAQVDEIFADDGQGIAAASVAVLSGESLWIGSVFDESMLVCSLSNRSGGTTRGAAP